jgi:hypothetical protein
MFPATTRTLTKDTALSEQGKGAAWHVWINARHGRGMLCVNPPLEYPAFESKLVNTVIRLYVITRKILIFCEISLHVSVLGGGHSITVNVMSLVTLGNN